MDLSEVWQSIVTYVSKYAFNVIGAIIVLIVGLKLIKYLKKLILKYLKKSKIDESVEGFIASFIAIALKVLLLVSIISILGVKTTIFTAVIGAAGLAIGLSLQGSLSNFAGGILILILKPFTIGDFIETDSQKGVVEQIDIFYTKIKTLDNKSVVIPNSIVSNNTLTNYTKNDIRRVDLTIGVGYKSDIEKVKKVLHKVVELSEFTLKDPEPVIRLGEMADSSLNFYVWVWIDKTNYWNAYFDIMEKSKYALDEAGINIPFPQMDVHLEK